MTRVFALFAALSLRCFVLSAQVTDSITYPEVQVEASRIIGAVGTRQHDVDTTLMAMNTHRDLAALLQLEGNVQVRSYGPGGIATFSMRGTTAGHTQVVWMGIPINDPMLGVSDLGTMNLGGLGGVRLLSGAAAMPHHAGGIGGTIELIEDAPRVTDGITALVSGEWASFGTYAAQAQLAFKRKKLFGNTSINYLAAENDFPYTDLAALGHPTKAMTHANVEQIGAVQSIGYKANMRNTISAHLRFAQTDRLLPPTMLMASTQETLFDRDVWLALRYRREGERSELTVTSSYIHGEQEYLGNDDYLYEYLYRSSKNIVRYEYRLHRKLTLRAGADIISEHAESDTAYESSSGVWRHSQALFASLTYSPVSWLRAQALVREDLIDGRFSPVQALGGVEVDALKWLRLSANVSRNFRNPTLNDLYWNPGGNPNLNSETGFSLEAGLELHRRWEKFGAKLEANWYRTDVDNWILWTPVAGNVWGPRNMRRVLAQGVEARLQLTADIAKVKLSLNAGYQYTTSTVKESDTQNDNSIGNQLIYVPVHGVQGHLSLHWKGLRFLYGHTWTGERFTASDNKTSLPAFHVGWVSASYRLPLKKHAVQLGGTIDNLFNHEYQMIAWRPMPGRAFRIALTYTFTS